MQKNSYFLKIDTPKEKKYAQKELVHSAVF